MPTRRTFLKTTGTVLAAAPVFPYMSRMPVAPALRIACQQYTWFSFYRREDKAWFADPEASMAAFTAAGLQGYEPAIGAVDEVAALQPYLDAHQVWMTSLYVNSILHEATQADQSIADALAVARAAKPLGVKIMVTNPSPLDWNGTADKTDAQLITQAKALNTLGEALRAEGIQLAYHNHDAEMRQSAREFHHMMRGTDPANVKLCLDAHWVYRGAGNSQVALFDIVGLYADRIVELHLRQSQDGIWREVFGPGDIDYPRLADTLLARGVRPHLVLEHAAEEGTPHTMNPIELTTRSLAYAEEVFAAFAK